MSNTGNDKTMRHKTAGVASSTSQQGSRHNVKVFVGLSGGVDSSVSAMLLKQQGYDVTGVYMKNWSQDLPGHHCPWKEDYQDAKRIAVQLGIPFKMYDFEKDYKQKVVDYMLTEFKAGRTPNPDVMCNQEVKFKLFLETALEDGADMIATGHYAQIKDGQLLMAKDSKKDQTYFLYRMSKEALDKTIFPIGGLTKPEVRKLAEEHKLVTAAKKESMGICFVGKVGIKDFLMNYVKTRPGKIIDQKGEMIGEHDGAIFYTIGQRHGLEVGGGLPYYVTGKDMKKNEVYVTTELDDKKLWSREVKLTDIHWINEPPKAHADLTVRLRHLGKLIPIKKLNPAPFTGASAIRLPTALARKRSGTGMTSILLVEEVRALTPGQSAVIYSGRVCLGGGILS